MNTFLHFLKSNIKYNKLELSISYVITLAVLIFAAIMTYKGESNFFEEDIFFSLSAYALLYAFFTNKKKFNLKYLLSLPMSRVELLIVKTTSDFVFLLPGLIFAGIALYHFPKFQLNPIAIFVILILAAYFIALYIFDTDVEQPRLENSRANFLNRLVYVRKIFDGLFMWLLLALAVVLAIAAQKLTGSTLMRSYVLIVTLTFFVVFKFKKSLKLLEDESLSYFIARRDLVTIGLKIAVFLAPAYLIYKKASIYVHNVYGHEQVYQDIKQGNDDKVLQHWKSNPKAFVSEYNHNGFTPFLAAVLEGRGAVVEKVMSGESKDILMKSFVKAGMYMGHYPIHLAVISKSPKVMIEKIYEMAPESIEQQLYDDSAFTPLQLASHNCENASADRLVELGADPNRASIAQKETPIMTAARKGCNSIVAQLAMNPKIELALTDKSERTVLDYLNGKKSLKYYIEKKLGPSFLESRNTRGTASSHDDQAN